MVKNALILQDYPVILRFKLQLWLRKIDSWARGIQEWVLVVTLNKPFCNIT
jgi:hypothetical protein